MWFQSRQTRQKLVVRVGTDHASDDTTRKGHVQLSQILGELLDRDSVSSPSICFVESVRYALNMACTAGD